MRTPPKLTIGHGQPSPFLIKGAEREKERKLLCLQYLYSDALFDKRCWKKANNLHACCCFAHLHLITFTLSLTLTAYSRLTELETYKWNNLLLFVMFWGCNWLHRDLVAVSVQCCVCLWCHEPAVKERPTHTHVTKLSWPRTDETLQPPWTVLLKRHSQLSHQLVHCRLRRQRCTAFDVQHRWWRHQILPRSGCLQL